MALVVALRPLLPHASFLWSFESAPKENYCLDKWACLRDDFVLKAAREKQFFVKDWWMLRFRFRQIYSTELFLRTQALWGPNLFLVNRQWYQPMLCVTEQIQVNGLILGNVEYYLENCVLKLLLYKIFCVVNKWKCAHIFSVAFFQGGKKWRKNRAAVVDRKYKRRSKSFSKKAEALGMQQTCSKQGSWLVWDVARLWLVE